MQGDHLNVIMLSDLSASYKGILLYPDGDGKCCAALNPIPKTFPLDTTNKLCSIPPLTGSLNAPIFTQQKLSDWRSSHVIVRRAPFVNPDVQGHR